MGASSMAVFSPHHGYPSTGSEGLGPGHHAHPPRDVPPFDALESLSELFANISLDVHLTGLSGAHKTRVTDVYCPDVRRSPYTNDYTVNHLDVVSCWKGLSFSQAAEVGLWESFFHEALEGQVTEVLRILLAEHLREHPEPTDSASIMPRLIRCISDNSARRIYVDMQRLVDDMIGLFYQSPHSHDQHSWFVGSGDLPAMVYNFVRTRDCFLDTFPRPSLEVDINYKFADSELYISGAVNWQPPVVDFRDLPIKLHAGAEYRIIPEYTSPDLGSCCGPKFPKFPDEPEFLVSSEIVPLQWDHDLHCFRTVLPTTHSPSSHQRQKDILFGLCKVGQNKGKMAETTFSTKLVMHFPGNVRFERTTRYNIKLEIIGLGKHEKEEPPSATHCAASPPRYVSGTSDATLQSDEPTDIHLTPRRNSSWLPSYTNTPVSKCASRVASDQSSPKSELPPEPSSVERDIRLFKARWQSGPFPWNTRDSPVKRGEGIDEKTIFAWNTLRSPNIAKNDQGVEDDTDEGTTDSLYRSPSTTPAGCKSPCRSPRSPDEKSDIEMTTFKNTLRAAEDVAIAKAVVKCDAMVNLTPKKKRKGPVPSRYKVDCLDSLHDYFFSSNRPATPNKLSSTVHPRDTLAWSDKALSVDFRDHIPQKRKATKQVPLSTMFENSSAFTETRLALDKFEHLDLELAAKRQKLDRRIDSGIHMLTQAADTDHDWDDEHVGGLGSVTTKCLGDANAVSSPTTNPCGGWFEKLDGAGARDEEHHICQSRSRAYEATFSDSKVMPSLRKIGSVKRIIFSRHKRSDSMSPTEHSSSRREPMTPPPELSQDEIQSNYQRFLSNSEHKVAKKNSGTEEFGLDGNKSEEDERKAYEKIFLEDSQTEDWSTEADDLSEGMSKIELDAA